MISSCPPSPPLLYVLNVLRYGGVGGVPKMLKDSITETKHTDHCIWNMSALCAEIIVANMCMLPYDT